MAGSNNNPKAARHILSLSTEEKQAFLESIDIVFSDIDGVVWNMEKIYEGSADGFISLKNAGKKVNFVTNNSVRPIDTLVRKLNRLNLDVDIHEVLHPAQSVVEYLRSINFDGLIYCIASQAFIKVLTDAGLELFDGPTTILQESLIELAGHVFDSQSVRAVVIDVDFNLSSTKLMKAHYYLRHPDCILVAGATDMLLPVRENFSILGPGPFLKVVAEASKKPVHVLGKPGKALAELLTTRYNIVDSKRALMIGDMLEQDVVFGKECGFQTLVVLSGGCSLEDLKAETDPRLIPDYYADSMKDFMEFMKDIKKSHV